MAPALALTRAQRTALPPGLSATPGADTVAPRLGASGRRGRLASERFVHGWLSVHGAGGFLGSCVGQSPSHPVPARPASLNLS